MREGDVDGQGVGLVPLVVQNVEVFVVLNDHDAAVFGELVQFERGGEVAHLLDTILVDQLERIGALPDDQNLVRYRIDHDQVVF